MTEQLSIQRTYVGSLRCQRESFLLNGFRTSVISCQSVETKEKKNKNGKKYEVEFQDSILFPEGGGQPSDSGYLQLIGCSGNNTVTVHRVSRDGLHAKHHVDTYLEPGTEVEMNVDVEKRLDYMQQHTGQHLLSAVLESLYDLDTLSWSMGGILSEKKTELEPNDYFNYIELARKLDLSEILEVSKVVENYIIVDPQEISVVEKTADEQGDIQTHKVPADYDLSKGILRTIHIGSLDSNPCCGTHLNSTAQIGSILIQPNQTSVRAGNSRLYFMCGNRVAKYGQRGNKIMTDSKAILSCPESQIPDKIFKMKDQIQKATKREQYWIKQLASYDSDDIVNRIKTTGKAFLMKDEFGTLDYLQQVYKQMEGDLVALSEYKVVLCGREKQSDTGSLIILSDSGESISTVSSNISSLIKTLKGGGGKKGGKWQGKIAQFSTLEYETVSDYLKSNF